MSKVTRRQVIRAGVAAGTALSAGTAHAGPEKGKPLSLVDLFLPARLTKDKIQAADDGTFTELEFAGSTAWVRCIGFGDGLPHTLIGIYAPAKDGTFHRSLFAESWAAGKIEATVDVKTGILELRDGANSDLKGQLVLSCNLKTIGTQHSIVAK